MILSKYRPRRLPGILFLLTVLLVTALVTRPAGADITPQQPLLCFMVQGNQDRTLALVPDDSDGADEYDVVTNYKPADGSFTQVATFTVGGRLNTKVTSEAHWVRSRSGSRTSQWLRCDSYRKVSSVAVEKPANGMKDYLDPDADVALGLDGNGQTETTPSYRIFEGENDDIVVVDVANRGGLAPNGKKMAWRAKFRLAEADLQTLKDGTGLSWNVMQRGLADDPGGQWKMSVASKDDDKISVQCATQDGRPGDIDKQLAELVLDSSDLKITNGFTRWITATCFSGDAGRSQNDDGVRGDSLQLVINGKASKREVFPEGVGHLINPSSDKRCTWLGPESAPDYPKSTKLADEFPKGIGHVYTIGNKPHCGSPMKGDRFVGQIDHAEVFKQ